MKIVAFVLAGLACVLSAAAQDEVFAWPDTPAGRRGAEFLAVYQTMDRDEILRYLESAMVPPPNPEEQVDLASYAAVYARRAEMFGQLTFDSIDLSEPTRLEASGFAAKTNAPVVLTVEVEAQEPHRIILARVVHQRDPSLPPPKSKLSPAEMGEYLGPVLERLESDGRFSGVVLIAEKGETAFEGAYGLASIEFDRPNTMQTRFNGGALAKMFTAVAVARLVEQGRLAYEDTVGKHLPGYPEDVVRNYVTIHDLLTHTAGLADIPGEQIQERSSRLRSVPDWLELAESAEMVEEPGQSFRYGAAPYIILGAIIEKATGRPYYQVVQEEVFNRAQMTETGFFDTDLPMPDTARGYTMRHPRRSGELMNTRSLEPVRGGPAGPVYTTAGDLARFAHALMDGELLSPASRELVMRGHVLVGGTQFYGYGLFVTQEDVPSLGHAGSALGANAQFDIYPTLGVVSVVLTNRDPNWAQRVGAQVNRWLTGR